LKVSVRGDYKPNRIEHQKKSKIQKIEEQVRNRGAGKRFDRPPLGGKPLNFFQNRRLRAELKTRGEIYV